MLYSCLTYFISQGGFNDLQIKAHTEQEAKPTDSENNTSIV